MITKRSNVCKSRAEETGKSAVGQKCLAAGNGFPSLRVPVLIEEYAVSDTARMTGEELEVPGLRSCSEPLQSLRIAEPTDQLILVHVSDARLEIRHVWSVPTGRHEEAEDDHGEQE